MNKSSTVFTIIQKKNETESTMEDLAEAVYNGHGHGAVCIARSQRAGRCRLPGRIWQNSPEALIFSTALAINSITVEYPPTQVLALALCLHLEKKHGLKPCIKWPNDVLLNGKKVAGILVEVESRGRFYLCGMGLNTGSPPIAIRDIATGLSDHLKTVPNAKEELMGILSELENLLVNPVSISEVEKRLAYIGRHVCIKPGNPELAEKISGHIAGLKKDGALLVDIGKGELTPIYSGETDFS